MRHLMVALDLSERADRALRRSVMLARQYGSRLTLVHVVNDDQPGWLQDKQRRQARSILERLAETLGEMDRVACTVRVPTASTDDGLVALTAELAPDLLIMGPRRPQNLLNLFGSTTGERAVRRMSCPMLLANGLAAGPYQHVMQTSDQSSASAEALRRFAGLGLDAIARKSLLHVFDAPALRATPSFGPGEHERDHYLAAERTRAGRALANFAADAGAAMTDAILRPLETSYANDILTAAEVETADLIMVSTHGRGGIAKLMLGSVAENIIGRAQIDVLAIPPRQAIDSE